jgi:hypothetical protein
MRGAGQARMMRKPGSQEERRKGSGFSISGREARLPDVRAVKPAKRDMLEPELSSPRSEARGDAGCFQPAQRAHES